MLVSIYLEVSCQKTVYVPGTFINFYHTYKDNGNKNERPPINPFLTLVTEFNRWVIRHHRFCGNLSYFKINRSFTSM